MRRGVVLLLARVCVACTRVSVCVWSRYVPREWSDARSLSTARARTEVRDERLEETVERGCQDRRTSTVDGRAARGVAGRPVGASDGGAGRARRPATRRAYRLPRSTSNRF